MEYKDLLIPNSYTMAADDLASLGARASAAVLLIPFNIFQYLVTIIPEVLAHWGKKMAPILQMSF